jgi:hypothetical protein
MALAGEMLYISMVADADLTGKQYTAVRVSGANKVNLASNAVALTAIGILQNDPALSQGARVAYIGESKARAGAAITAGVRIAHNSSGKVIAATSGSVILGTALEAANADEDVIRVLLTPGQAIGQI